MEELRAPSVTTASRALLLTLGTMLAGAGVWMLYLGLAPKTVSPTLPVYYLTSSFLLFLGWLTVLTGIGSRWSRQF